MAGYNIISATQVADRLDAEYYGKVLLENEQKLASFQQITLENVVKNEKNAIADLTSNGSFEFLRGIEFNADSGIPFIRTQNLMDGYIDNQDMLFVSVTSKEKVSKSLCKTGDLVVCRKGKVGAASAISPEMDGAAISENVTRFRLKEDSDADFLSAFLNSKQGRTRFLREATGVIQKWINNEKLRQIKVIQLNNLVEKYIGDKVRQAELLREWKKRQQKQLNELEAKIGISKPQEQEHSSIKVVKHALTENRLDSKYYQRKYLDLYAQFNHEYVKLSELCSGFKYGASVAAQYTEQGVPFIRGNAIYPNGINSKDIVKLDENLNDSLGSCFTALNDILITRSGTVGVTTFVSEKFENFAYGSFIIKCKIIDNGYLPEYVSWFLNCWVGQQQFRRLENGAVQLNINIEELGSINIWKAPMELQLLIKSKIHQINICELLIDHVLTSSKLLVEGLIEGTITEDDLIQAQNALEQGDISLDRAILSQMTEDGYAVAGSKPLFSDLDEFYDLLEQAKALE